MNQIKLVPDIAANVYPDQHGSIVCAKSEFHLNCCEKQKPSNFAILRDLCNIREPSFDSDNRHSP